MKPIRDLDCVDDSTMPLDCHANDCEVPVEALKTPLPLDFLNNYDRVDLRSREGAFSLDWEIADSA